MPLWERACSRSGLSDTHHSQSHAGKKIPDQAVTGSGQEALLEELSREGDQTIVIQLEASVPSPEQRQLAENDTLIAI
jgi:hypothetical protein